MVIIKDTNLRRAAEVLGSYGGLDLTEADRLKWITTTV